MKPVLNVVVKDFLSYLMINFRNISLYEINGLYLIVIKELLRHASIDITIIYSHLSGQHKYNKVEKLPWIKSR